ncbi:MAG: amidohydrolase family protein [Anaerolineae bacterium]
MPTALINALIVNLPEFGGTQIAPLRFERHILSLGVSPKRGDTVLDLAGFAIYPGLVNAHDHLELNHFPRSKFREVYDNAYQWGEEFLPRLAQEPFCSLRQVPLSEQCRIGLEKNLRSGVTTVAHHNPLHRPLRRKTPIRILSQYGWAHSLHFTGADAVRARYLKTPKRFPFMIHLAEGTDEAMQGELSSLDELGCLGHNTVLIHGVGLTESDRQRAINAGAGLVWCPSTNLYLLGKTAQVAEFSRARRLAIGSDSLLTADGDLLDELRAAYATGQLTPESLFRAVTVDAAELLCLPEIGVIAPNYRADLLVTLVPSGDPYAALIQLRREQIVQVFVGGLPRLAKTQS